MDMRDEGGSMTAQTTTRNYYSARGNRSLTVASLHIEDGTPVDNEDDAYAVAENLAYQWGESLTLLHNDKPFGQVLPDRGF
jgi:hypothetical protein